MPRPKASNCFPPAARFWPILATERCRPSTRRHHGHRKIFAQTQFNGDGIIPAEAAEDAASRRSSTTSSRVSVANRTAGKAGRKPGKVDNFSLMPRLTRIGGKRRKLTPRSCRLMAQPRPPRLRFKAVKNKVEDYFTRCRLAAFDPRAVSALNREEKEYLAFAAKDLTCVGRDRRLSARAGCGRQSRCRCTKE